MPVSPIRAAVLAALPLPLSPRSPHEARLAERLLAAAEARVDAAVCTPAEAAVDVWRRWLAGE